ncbi:MAG: glycerol kinase GlpK [Pseudomonadales bacterium]
MADFLLAIDQGTTSSRAILFAQDGTPLSSAQREFKQYFPADGWVEHDPEEIWQTTAWACEQALKDHAARATDVLAIGITNQRETIVLWDRATGEAVYPAIVWQDRRTHQFCERLKKQGHEANLQEKTGLLLDPYFSASKLRWLLDEVPGVRERAERGELACGTIDTFLIWRLTGGQVHATDATNAARTALFNIHLQEWDAELLDLFGIPAAILPTVENSSALFGETDPAVLGAPVKICGVAGDQQAALIGQACFDVGSAKSTYGTGCFLMLNTGTQALRSTNRLLTTVAYRLDGEVTYALEGSIFNAGTAIQWLRDQLGLIKHAGEVEAIAEQTPDTGGVYLVPAFTGLGAPYWDAAARGILTGLTRDSNRQHIVSAALQSVAYQTRDLIDAMAGDGQVPAALRVDGGMTVNNWLLQFLADTLGASVTRSSSTETTALGAAYLAGLQVGVFKSLQDIGQHWRADREFMPTMAAEQREANYAGWVAAVKRARSDVI